MYSLQGAEEKHHLRKGIEMEKYEIIKQATSTGEPPEYTYTVMPDGMIFDTKQEAKDYIYSRETQMVLEDRP